MIRKAEIKDIPRIAEIFVFGKRVAYRSIFRDDSVSFNEITVASLMEEYYKYPNTMEDMLVYDDGIVKGVINLGIDKKYCKMEIKELYIEPFFKNHGIGSLLMNYSMTIAIQLGLKEVSLWVLKDNEPAKKFYKKYGFTVNGRQRLVDRTQDTVEIQYEKRL